jgi:hypothetical protein
MSFLELVKIVGDDNRYSLFNLLKNGWSSNDNIAYIYANLNPQDIGLGNDALLDIAYELLQLEDAPKKDIDYHDKMIIDTNDSESISSPQIYLNYNKGIDYNHEEVKPCHNDVLEESDSDFDICNLVDKIRKKGRWEK